MGEVRRFAAVLLCACGIAAPESASAQTAAPIELKWSALEGCPSADSVLARVRKIAGTTRPTPNTLRADATITQPSDGLFRLRLEIQYGNLAAVRNIEGKSCKDLAGAAAVALALLLSSEEPLSERDLAGTASGTAAATGASGATTAAGNEQPDSQAPPLKPDTSTTPTQPPPSPPDADAGPPRRWRALLVVPLGALGVGPMEQLSLGIGLGAGVSFDRWQFLLEGKLWASQHEIVHNVGNDYDVELDRFTLGARGCRGVVGSRFELAPCALVSVHRLAVNGSGPNLVSSRETVTWAAVGLGAQARLLITPWLGLVALLDGEVQLSRPEINITLPMQGSTSLMVVPVTRLSPVAATLSLGSQWIF